MSQSETLSREVSTKEYTQQPQSESVEHSPPPRARKSKGELALALLLLVSGAFTIFQAFTMDVIGESSPGPTFFPFVVGALLIACALLIAFNWVRNDAKQDTEAASVKVDWMSLGGAAGTFLLFILVLEPLGWLIAASLLFWGTSFSLGGKNYVTNAAIAITFASVTQIVFSIGLGINLPAGIFGGLG